MNPASRAGGSAQGFAMERRVADLRRTELRPADAKHRFYACERSRSANDKLGTKGILSEKTWK